MIAKDQHQGLIDHVLYRYDIILVSYQFLAANVMMNVVAGMKIASGNLH